MHKITLALSPLLLLFCMGSTDCDAYAPVTVPVADATAPDTWDGVWLDGEYVALQDQSVPITYHLAIGQSVIAVGSGLDTQSGVKKVVMSAERAWTCCNIFNTICSTSQTLMAPISDSQSGSVGSSVSNGMWVGTEVSLDPAPTCQVGYYLKSYQYKWTTTATNFLGKTRVGPTRRIVYP